MPLSRRDRFRLLRQLLERLEGRSGNEPWTDSEITLLLTEFGFDTAVINDPWTGDRTKVGHLLGGVSDATLVDMYSAVFDVESVEVIGAAAASDEEGVWRDGYVRLFLSHSATHKAFAAEVSAQLAVVGIDAFVAHDAMEVTRPWQSQIERALNTAELFVALVHPEVNGSAWCHQEIGWSQGRGIPWFFLRLGADPAGFPGWLQWPAVREDATVVSEQVIGWLNGRPEWSDRISGGLFQALLDAGNYYDAEAAAKRIDALGTLTRDQLVELDRIFLANDQVGQSVLATRALRPVYDRHGRAFPSNP
jgi:hypothetical protein